MIKTEKQHIQVQIMEIAAGANFFLQFQNQVSSVSAVIGKCIFDLFNKSVAPQKTQ